MSVRSPLLPLATLALAAGCASTSASRVERRAPVAGSLASPAATSIAPAPPEMDYYVFAASEGNDQIALIRFGPSGIRVERRSTTGIMPSDIDG
ncbi:MAG TPA: hypothetical protein VFI52_12885, partial [Gemmatimonadaceae bacterium]|nr:hypothetical protein [Gemmatimonadaceae bacterium]